MQTLLCFPSSGSVSFQTLALTLEVFYQHAFEDGKVLLRLGYIEELPRTRPKLYTLTDKGKELIAAIHAKFNEICERAEHGY